MNSPTKIIRASSSAFRSLRSVSSRQRSFCQILQERQIKKNVPSILCTSTSRFSSTGSSDKKELSAVPSKETLLRIDWMLEHQVPDLLKSRLSAFFATCEDNVTLEDKLYNFKVNSKAEMLNHITKMRMYFRYKSPFNKFEYIGSCIYEGEDVVTILWRLSSLQSSFMTYFPSFLRGKEPKINVQEGALDVHVTREGKIYRMVNRKITAADREGAKIMKALKDEGAEARKAEAEKQMKKELDEDFHTNRAS